MANNYAKVHPQDQGGTVLQNYPAPFVSKQDTYSDNAGTSAVKSFTHDTTVIEVGAHGGAVAIKWIATSDTTASVVTTPAGANFDHVIPSNWTQRFVVPVETMMTNPQSVQGANRANGLYQRIAYKSFGVASITLSEF